MAGAETNEASRYWARLRKMGSRSQAASCPDGVAIRCNRVPRTTSIHDGIQAGTRALLRSRLYGYEALAAEPGPSSAWSDLHTRRPTEGLLRASGGVPRDSGPRAEAH